MSYITKENTVYLRDRLASLSILEDIARASEGDEVIRESILAKISKAREADKARFSETVLPNGNVRLRHPAIAVVAVDHSVLEAPVQMFGNKTKSLTAYTMTVSRAEAIVTPEGLLSYEPYEVVGQFKLSELTYNQMVANPSAGSFPVTIEKLNGHVVEPTIPCAFVNQPRQISKTVEARVAQMGDRLAGLAQTLEALHTKGGKMSQSTMTELSRREMPSTYNFSHALAYDISKVAEFSQEVTTAQRIEIEAFIAIKQAKGE